MPTLTSFSNRPLDRAEFIKLLDTALNVKEYSYARLLALAWLTTFPGDLGAGLRHARALVGLKLHRQAIPVLETICQADPEFLEAQQLLAQCAGPLQHPANEDAQASIIALTPQSIEQVSPPAPKWGKLLRQAKSFQAKQAGAKSASDQEKPTGGALGGEYGRLVHAALLENPASPLAALAHLYFMREGCARGEIVADAVTSLARAYHARWPRCLAFSLLLADRLMDHGAGDEAVALLHQVAARDVTAQVAARIWGKSHPYRSLWPEKLVIEPVSKLAGGTLPQGLQIPAAVSAALGLNQLAPATVHPAPAAISKSNGSIRHSARMRGSQTASQASSVRKGMQHGKNSVPHGARFPVYVILSNRQALQQTYGLAPSRRVEAAARRLVRAIANRPDWDAILFFPPNRPAPYTPWDLKLALADLDDALAARGERIGALLILGGPEIVPFHYLPNPVDDSDDAVPSDNPYATRDENYFVAEWPVGRLPGGAGSDPALLIENLERYAAYHSRGSGSSGSKPSWVRRWLENLGRLVRPPAFAWPPSLALEGNASYGYTAAVWQRASLSVFQPIGQGGHLKVSPPEAIDARLRPEQPQLRLPAARMAYFNLHGQRDSALWYGQSAPASFGSDFKSDNGGAAKRRTAKSDQPGNQAETTFSNPDFPVALRPVDIFPGLDETGFGWLPEWLAGPAPKKAIPGIVFSEACFGAHIDGRSTEQAISLTFLHAGANSFVGSTCIAYGTISMPLMAADLLGHAFWQYLMEGHPAGEALRRAKIYLSTEMDRRQGYLDGEDQKTLISFVLYGDPLYQETTRTNGKAAKRMTSALFQKKDPAQAINLEDALTNGLEITPLPVYTVCDRAGCCSGAENGSGASSEGREMGSVPPEVMANVRQIVSKYLPGMSGASMKLANERAAGQGQSCSAHGTNCPTAQLGAKAAVQPSSGLDRRVITLSKTITRPADEPLEGQAGQATISHQQFARLTLDSSSKLVKLVVSR